MGALARGDDGDWLDLVADLLRAPPTRLPTERIGWLLVEMLAAAGCSYWAHGLDGESVDEGWPPEHFAPYRAEMLHYATHVAPTRHPLLRYYAATGDIRAMQVCEVPAAVADDAIMAEFRERGRAWGGVRAQMTLPLTMGPGGGRTFAAQRVDVFTPGEMARLRRVQRLLAGVDRHVGAYAGWAARSGPAGADVASAIGLTPRQLAVFELLADGLTAAAIGRRLHIAERTVQKHLERVYARLGVADRLVAVRRAETIGLLRPPLARGGT